jgi:hypothetical protein
MLTTRVTVKFGDQGIGENRRDLPPAVVVVWRDSMSRRMRESSHMLTKGFTLSRKVGVLGRKSQPYAWAPIALRSTGLYLLADSVEAGRWQPPG